MTSHRYIPAEDLQSVAIKLTTGVLALEAYAQNFPDMRSDLTHGALSLRECMVILFGESKTNECIEALRLGIHEEHTVH